MKAPRIVNALGKIDDDLISAAESSGKKNRGAVWGTLAACFAALVIVGLTVFPSLIDENKTEPGESMTSSAAEYEDTNQRYKNFTVNMSESSIIWPWEYLTEAERYYETEIDGIKYEKKSGRTISDELIGDTIGSYNIVGYDENTEEHPTVFCEVRQIKDVSQTQFVAVNIADEYYVFKNSVYNPPKTLGKLFETVDLSELLKLERFSENGDGPESNHFILKDDNYIWQILSECETAAFIDRDRENWHMYDREFISFNISSEALGVYKQDFSITEDGYLSTNAFDWGYLYYIGEDAAGKIIKYAKDNSEKTLFEPYNTENYLYGKITEITDDYILVDDSVLCKNQADGITYKVLINNIQLSRYLDLKVIKVDQTVKVSFEGEIDKKNLNTIDSAFRISDVSIHYEDEFEEEYHDDKSGSVSSTVSKIVEIDE